MINWFLQFITGKQLVFINPHRNSVPLINDLNRKSFIFVNPIMLWKATFVFGSNSKMRYRAMAIMLSIIKPRYIIDINWITRLHTLYFVWCKKQTNRKFIVIQHGTYAAGLISDIPHRIMKCNLFLAWSDYFKSTLLQYNPGKKIEIVTWGNPVYNQYNRNQYRYKEVVGNKILLAPSLLLGDRLAIYQELPKQLTKLGFDVFVKEHSFQKTKSTPIAWEQKIGGDLFSVLQSGQFDVVITDISSAMNDIIFFKTRVIFCSPPGNWDFYTNNIYTLYLQNLALAIDQLKTKADVLKFVDVNAQEQLLAHLVDVVDQDNGLLKL
ncbi:MAG: hypothetical protein RLY16_2973 [Bacteroidota bacterium]